MASVLLESRSFRPFKSSEEYLYAMKEDLAEWFQMLYPHLRITVENFLDRLETGVTLCEHANAVRAHAKEYVQKKQARKVMTRSVTGSLAQAQTLVEICDVKYFSTTKPGTFFARDNVSNFIHWCRQSLQIIECLLFESDDLIMRKNEKHVILCLLEVARRGARFGMLAPMLVQMERQIDREIAADQRRLGQYAGIEGQNGLDDDSDSEMEDEQPVLMYGPLPQIVTNDLKSLDEMVRDLVAKCTCPTQFPMIRVSEGKYRIGDTKVLIFVRILRNHVMVRVGGGWDTLAHYLDKHDPCRCRSQHRTTQGARLVNRPGAADLVGAQVYYDRSPPRHQGIHLIDSPEKRGYLTPPTNTLNRSRSRSPSTQLSYTDSRRSASPNLQRKSLAPPVNRSRSPTPNFTSTHTTKLSSNRSQQKSQGPQSLPYIPMSTSPVHLSKHANGKTPSNIISSLQIPVNCKSEATLQVSDHSTDHSDNTSEVSDEGYRSLGLVVGDKTRNRTSLYSQNSTEDAEYIEHQDSIDYDDDTNDVGLRRTQFSQKIYNSESPKHFKELFDTPKPSRDIIDSPKQFSDTSEIPKVTRIPSSKLPSRSNSIDAIELTMKSKIPPSSPRKSATKPNVNNTWNGKAKAPRASLAHDTFTPPPAAFTRTSPARRSIASFDSSRRNSQSANTSPTKSFRQELLKAAKKSDDDHIVIEEVHKLLKQFGSLTILNDFEDLKKTDDGKVLKSRKDSRPDVVTRIPAPISHRA